MTYERYVGLVQHVPRIRKATAVAVAEAILVARSPVPLDDSWADALGRTAEEGEWIAGQANLARARARTMALGRRR